MSFERNNDYLIGLVHELCKLPKESGWVEFKHNNEHPDEIGEYISALANSSAYAGKATAYLVWGVDNTTHEIIGTTFSPSETKIGNEELENWLLKLLAPKIRFHFYEFKVDEKPVVLLEIERAFRHPVQFKNIEYIRIGSYKKSMKDYPEIERELWRIFDRTPFEKQFASEEIDADEVLKLIDYPAYFDLLDMPLPTSSETILKALDEEGMIGRSDRGRWNITNLGAILFAKKLSDFPSLKRKAMRVIQYKATAASRQQRSKSEQKGTQAVLRG